MEELKFVLSNLPVKITKEEVKEILDAADEDNDGKISFEEFRNMIGI